MAKVTIIVVTYNAIKWLKGCLGSIDISKYNVIVIDNASTDETVTTIETEYPIIELIKSNQNLGFGKANNIGLKKALENQSDYILLLNQDAWLEPNTIDELIKEQQKSPDYWILSPLQRQSKLNCVEEQFDKYLQKNKIDINKEGIQEVDFVNAAIWLITRNCIETVGGFDCKLFPHYGEDNDYTRRVFYWGGKVGIASKIIGYHDREKSTVIVNKEKSIYKTTLALTGLLKNINHSVLLNCIFVSKIVLTKVLKYIISPNFRMADIYIKSFFKTFSQFFIIKEHRKMSLQTKAFLN